MNNIEIWKDIIINNKTTKYQVSNFGRVKNKQTNRILSRYLSDGKLRVTLVLKSDEVYDTKFPIDLLVLRAFLEITVDPGFSVYYRDGDISNLRLDNLEYLSHKKYLEKMVLRLFKKKGDYYIIKDNNLHKDEKWKFIYINGNLTHYLISNYGHIFNSNTGLYLNPSFGTHGYPFITFRFNGKSYKMAMHRLVAEYFIPNPDPDKRTIVHHKNHNRADFIYTNLEWVTQSINMNEAIKFYADKSGENSPNAKITRDEAVQICEMIDSGYKMSVIARTIGCKPTTVKHIKERKTWKEVSKDYSFKNAHVYFIDKKLLDSARYLRSKGVTRNEVHDILGISLTTIAKLDNRGYDFILNIKSIIEMNILLLHENKYHVSEISSILGVRKSYIESVIECHENEVIFNHF